MALALQAVVSLNTSGFQSGMGRLRQSVNSAVGAIGFAIGGVAAEIMTMARAFGALGAAVVVFKAATTQGLQFEQAMANVKSVSGLADNAIRELSQSARDMSKTMRTSAVEGAEALYSLASAGVAGKDALQQTLRPALLLAGATMSETSVATETLTATLKNLRLPFSQARAVADQFSGAIAASPATMDRLADAMKFAGPAAGAFGIGLKMMVKELAAFHQAGLKGQQAGTAFRMVLIKLSAEATAGKSAVGKALEGWKASTDGITGAVRRLTNAGISSETVFQALGARAGTGMAAMMNLGSEAIDNLGARIQSGANVAKMYEIQMATVQSRLAVLGNLFKEVGLKIFDVMKPAIEVVVDAMIRMAQAIDLLTKPVLTTFLAIVTPAFQLMGDVIGSAASAVGGFLTRLTAGLRSAVGWMQRIPASVKGFMTLVVGVTLAAAALTKLKAVLIVLRMTTLPALIVQIKAAGAAFISSFLVPILQATAIAAAALSAFTLGQVISNIQVGSKTIGQHIEDLFVRIGALFQIASELLPTSWSITWNSLKLISMEVAEAVVAIVRDDMLVPILKSMQGFMGTLLGIWQGPAFVTAMKTSVAAAISAFEDMETGIKKNIETTRGTLKKLDQDWANAGQNADDAWSLAMESIRGNTADKLGGAAISVKDFGAAFKEQMGTNLTAVVGGANEAVGGLTKSFGGAIAASSDLGDKVGSAMGVLEGAAGKTADSLTLIGGKVSEFGGVSDDAAAKIRANVGAVEELDAALKSIKLPQMTLRDWLLEDWEITGIVWSIYQLAEGLGKIRWPKFGLDLPGINALSQMMEKIGSVDTSKLNALSNVSIKLGSEDISAIRKMMERMEGVLWA